MNVIFAVTKEKLDVYRKLSKHIEGSAVGELADDSSNIVELVRENYNVRTRRTMLLDICLFNNM